MKRYRINFKNEKYGYAIGVGNTRAEGVTYAKEHKRIGNKKIKSVYLASR